MFDIDFAKLCLAIFSFFRSSNLSFILSIILSSVIFNSLIFFPSKLIWIIELANKEVEANQDKYDSPNLYKDSEEVNLEKIEQAFDIIEEEIDNLAITDNFSYTLLKNSNNEYIKSLITWETKEENGFNGNSILLKDSNSLVQDDQSKLLLVLMSSSLIRINLGLMNLYLFH